MTDRHGHFSPLEREELRNEQLEENNRRLRQERSAMDCRYAGRYAETSGSHCPIESPCLRCCAERADAEVARLREALSHISGFDCAESYVRSECGSCPSCIARDALAQKE